MGNVCCFEENEDPRDYKFFTTCYKSYDKIKRAYSGLSKQTFIDWEWIILDDSPEDGHFFYIREFSIFFKSC